MHDPTHIRAVIFDLGGVLLRTDDPEPRTALARRLGYSRKELERLVFENPASHEAEHGLLTSQQAWEAIAQSIRLPESDIPDFSRQFFEGDQVDFSLIKFLQQLRPRYTTALLSNTWVKDLPKFLTEDLHIPDTFDVIISSAQCGMAKPEPGIFRLALEAVQAEPDEAVFVDDSDRNISAAAALGIQTVHFRNAPQAVKEIQALLQTDAEHKQ